MKKVKVDSFSGGNFDNTMEQSYNKNSGKIKTYLPCCIILIVLGIFLPVGKSVKFFIFNYLLNVHKIHRYRCSFIIIKHKESKKQGTNNTCKTTKQNFVLVDTYSNYSSNVYLRCICSCIAFLWFSRLYS